MPTYPILFEDTGEIRDMEPVRWIPGRELPGGLGERGPSTPVFDLPRGYHIVIDEMSGQLKARKV